MTLLVLALLGQLARDPLLPGNPYVLRGATDTLLAVAFSPDGKQVAAAGRDPVVRVWSLDTGKPTLTLEGASGQVNALAWSKDGARLAAGDVNYQVHAWETRRGQLVGTVTHPEAVMDVAFSPDGAQVAVGGQNGLGAVYEVASGKFVREFRARAVRYSGDGKRLLTGGRTGELGLLELPRGKLLQTANASPQVPSVDWAADGKTFISFSRGDDAVRRWEGSTLKPIDAISITPRVDGGLPPRPTLVTSAALARDARAVAIATSDHRVRLWDLTRGVVATTFPLDRDGFVALSPATTWLAVGDGPLLKLWPLGAADAGRGP